MIAVPAPVAKALAALGALALVFAAGMWFGHGVATDAAAAQHTADLAAKSKEFVREIARGEEAGQALREQLQAQARYVTTLDERLRNGPALAITRPTRTALCVDAPGGRPAVDAAGGAGRLAADRAGAAVDAGVGGAAGGAPAAGDAGPGADRAPPAAPGAAEEPGPVLLTAWSVSLWNSALFGVDVPAGACRADEPASAACAAESGLTLDDAWRNHAANAASCAEDRTRYQRLIDHIRARQP